MKLKNILAVLLVLVIVGVLASVKFGQFSKLIAAGEAMQPPPETVSSAVAVADQWEQSVSAIGSITAFQGVTITPDIPGVVREIAFESGATVKKGDLLVRLDTSSEDAQLRAIEAQVQLARINLERAQKLGAQNTISQSELDTAEATLKQMQAEADGVRATIAKKTLRAPFDGRLGIRLVNLGEYLDLGKPVVSLQSLAPVYADFSLPQQELARVQTGMRVRLAMDTYPGRAFEGVLTAINPDLDSSTRSVRLRATFENSDEALRPGMFARAEVVLPGKQDVLMIPITSVLSSPSGDSVYVIESLSSTNGGPAELVVRQQIVHTGRTRGDFVSVQSGLKAGERVASSGLFKLRNGVPVVENNETVPKASTTPHPSNG